MPRITIRDVGKYGIIADIPEQELPPEAWSAGDNVAFRDGYVEVALGGEEVYGDTSFQPYRVFPALSLAGVPYWVYCGETDVRAITPGDPATHTEITRNTGTGDYGGFHTWQSTWLNGVLILNNGNDYPQVWSPIAPATRLVNLANWPSTWTAKTVRAFGNFLLALNINKSTTKYPTLLSWSHPADPGSVPSSWDVADATKLTGDKTFTATSGALVDCLPLSNANVVYKEDAIILQQYIGGNDIFSWSELSAVAGLAGQQCVVEFQPGLHVLLTKDYDVVVCDGRSIKSVASERCRSTLRAFGNAYVEYSFLFHIPQLEQVWVCLAYNGEFASIALIWNYKSGTWGQRTLGSGWIHASRGDFRYESEARSQDILYIAPSQTKTYHMSHSAGSGAGAFYVQRHGLALIGQARDGTPRVDYTKHKVVTEIWPLIEAPNGTTFTVMIEAVENVNEFSTNFGPTAQTFTFDPNADQKIDCLVEGKYINIYFGTEVQVNNWKFYGYSLEMNVVGEYN